jgi:hypothetical protein
MGKGSPAVEVFGVSVHSLSAFSILQITHLENNFVTIKK